MTVDRSGAGDAHPGDELSALLDGELTADRAVEVRQHLEACPSCRAELAHVEGARSVVRALAMVEPPEGLFDRLTRGRARLTRSVRGWGVAANLVATAAAWLLVLAVTSGVTPLSAQPPVSRFVDEHAAAGLPLPTGSPPEPAAPPAEAGGRFRVPVRLGGHVLGSASVDGDLLQARYTDGLTVVSLFEQPGRLDWSTLPPGQRVSVDGHDSWVARVGQSFVVITERGDLTLALVGPGPAERLLALVPALPEPPPPSLGDRLRAVGHDLVDTFSFGG
ncbi:MAG: zf-HC2 domain-containing protein [Acidimicrobiales bacterium]|nr:zf-HC2 domain-containing protein [Acidimicrobiales bacterium]